jgi:integrase
MRPTPPTCSRSTRRRRHRVWRLRIAVVGELQGGSARHSRPAPEFAVAAQRYLAHLAQDRAHRPATLRLYRTHVERHLTRFFDGPLADIGPARVASYSAARRDVLAPHTIGRRPGILRDLFAFAVARGWVDANPVSPRRVRPPVHGHRARRRPLSAGERAALLGGVGDDAGGAFDRLLYATASRTRLSLSELLALQWGDIELAARRVRVQRCLAGGRWAMPKRGIRVEPLDQALVPQLAAHRPCTPFHAAGDLVFGDPTGAGIQSPARVRRRLRRAAARAGLPAPVLFIDLRRAPQPSAVARLARRVPRWARRWS